MTLWVCAPRVIVTGVRVTESPAVATTAPEYPPSSVPGVGSPVTVTVA